MSLKVAKFGGSSLANAAQFRRVINIINADSDRRFIVVSAPGKGDGQPDKVTDLLYRCCDAATTYELFEAFGKVEARFISIVEDLDSTFDIKTHLNKIRKDILSGAGMDYIVSRGEYLCGLILADYLGYDFADAALGICFTQDGEYDDERTARELEKLLSNYTKAVIPGFYGARPDGTIKTFTRGGSDITGALVARAVKADIYENWTDVPGFMMADPRIVPNPKTIEKITYRELRELSYMGASVLHEDSVFPVRKSGIPINVRSTNEPELPGTMIGQFSDEDDQTCRITGIAGRKDFTIIHIEKDKMNNELGFGRKVLSVFERNGVSLEHLPTSIDSLSVVVSSAQLKNGKLEKIISELEADCKPDMIDVHADLALIATVGRNMVRKIGIAARLCGALAKAGVNIRLIDQGSSEINIIVGVEDSDFETAVRAIYAEFAED